MKTQQWIEVVNTLSRQRPDLIKTRDTDHEYRTDDRDIIEWNGQKIWIPVDSLAHDNEQNNHIRSEMLKCYQELKNHNNKNT